MTTSLQTLLRYCIDAIFPLSAKEATVRAMCSTTLPAHISTSRITLPSGKHINTLSLCDYNDVRVRDAVHSLKYTKSAEAQKLFATLLGDNLILSIANRRSVYPAYAPSIVPMPLSKKRLNARGFNQVSIVLKRMAANYPELGQLICNDLLIKHMHTNPQTHLTRKERLLNIKGSLSCDARQAKGKDIIIIDDVLTTGATALEASKVLMRAKAKSVLVLTLSTRL